jgi:sugar lactone lactonase YvrE
VVVVVIAILLFSLVRALLPPGAFSSAFRDPGRFNGFSTTAGDPTRAPDRPASSPETPGLPPTVQPAPAFASPALSFGGEGIGPGLFTDARSLALDGAGQIYVGEYTGGRIQVFDPAGKFLNQWAVNPKTPLRALAADRQGTVYVVQGGEINRYEGATGKGLGTLEYAGGQGFDDLVVSADGGLVAAWVQNRDDIVRFDDQGQAVLTLPAAISSQSGESELNTRVAVDGLGNIYALGTFNDAVFKFSSEGRFFTRFGSAGDEPGQFRAPQALAVDGQGRVFVSDIKGIQVFDSNGRYLDRIELEGDAGVAFGLTFNEANELFVAARTQVIKFVIRTP